MKDNNTNNWSDGLKFVQVMKNRAYHDGIKRSPYKAMFGIDLKIGLLNSKLRKELMEGINTEKELLDIVNDTSIKNTLDENDVPTSV